MKESSILKALMVANPEMVDMKPDTTGELVLFSYLDASLSVLK